jgi:hypothetical protein
VRRRQLLPQQQGYKKEMQKEPSVKPILGLVTIELRLCVKERRHTVLTGLVRNTIRNSARESKTWKTRNEALANTTVRQYKTA